MEQKNACDIHKLLELTVQVTAAYVSNNKIEITEVPKLIDSIYTTIKSTASTFSSPYASLYHSPDSEKLQELIKKSIQKEYIVCLEDGKKLKMLKRYLKTNYGMSPEEYKRKWGLPADYPMVAPNYAEQRSELAKNIGLGVRTRKNTKRHAQVEEAA